MRNVDSCLISYNIWNVPLDFLEGQTSLDDIGAFRTTASLSSIVAENLDPASKMSSLVLDPDPAGRESPRLEIMDLCGSHFPHTELRKLFEVFPTVTTLVCGIPGQVAMPERDSFITMTSAFSPGLIAQAFAPLQESLVNLALNDEPIIGFPDWGPFRRWPGHDHTRIDLKDFVCLKVLHVPSQCFFERSPLVQRKGVRTLLPPSLEDLKVRAFASEPLSKSSHSGISVDELRFASMLIRISFTPKASSDKAISMHVIEIASKQRLRTDIHGYQNSLAPTFKTATFSASAKLRLKNKSSNRERISIAGIFGSCRQLCIRSVTMLSLLSRCDYGSHLILDVNPLAICEPHH